MGSKRNGLHKLSISTLLLAIFIICSLTFSNKVKAQSSDFTIENGILLEYKSNDKLVFVPDNVTIISKDAFRSNEVITEVVLPKGLKRIEDQAFFDCTELRSIQIPNSVSILATKYFIIARVYKM